MATPDPPLLPDPYPAYASLDAPWQHRLLERFEQRYGRLPELRDPQAYTDKLAWRLLLDHDPLYETYGSKLHAPEFATARAGDDIAFAKRYAIFSTLTRRDFDTLPDRFVLKASHASGLNEFVADKATADIDAIVARFAARLHTIRNAQGWADPNAVVIAEEWLDDGTGTVPIDYKFHCFHAPGRPFRWFLHVVRDRYGEPRTTFYDDSLQPVDFQFGRMELSPDPFVPPANFDTTIRVAEALSADFDYIRIDLQNIDGRTYLGELTPFHEGGVGQLDSAELDELLGSFWTLRPNHLARTASSTPAATTAPASTIADERYVRLTTFTRDGRRKETPVWIVALDGGGVGFTTALDSWKAKRIRNTPAVELTPSDMRGRVADGVPSVSGTARLVSAAALEPVMAAIKAKYGFQMTMIQFVGTIKSLIGKGSNEEPGGVIITVD